MSGYRNKVTAREPYESTGSLRLKSTVFLGYTDIAAAGIRALLGIDLKKEFYNIDVPSLQGSNLSCVNPNPVDPREQAYAPVQVWNLKYEQFSVVLVNTAVSADKCHHVCGRIIDLCKESLIDRLVVLSATRVDIACVDTDIFENVINIKKFTSCPSLTEDTKINDPFLCTLIQMIKVDYLPVSFLVIPAHRACYGQAREEDGSQQVISKFQKTINDVTKIHFDEEFSYNLVYKNTRDKQGNRSSMYT